jgi:hypothetical protein
MPRLFNDCVTYLGATAQPNPILFSPLLCAAQAKELYADALRSCESHTPALLALARAQLADGDLDSAQQQVVRGREQGVCARKGAHEFPLDIILDKAKGHSLALSTFGSVPLVRGVTNVVLWRLHWSFSRAF